jgi:hypothetical protein
MGLEPRDFDPTDAVIIKRHQLLERYHWTYEQYLNTPAHVIEEELALLRTENKATEDKNDR